MQDITILFFLALNECGPPKIWMNGMIQDGERLDIIDPTPDYLDNFGNFGIDGNGPVPEEHQ